MRDTHIALPTQLGHIERVVDVKRHGGVSSFGYSGIIAHNLFCLASPPMPPVHAPLTFRCKSWAWHVPAHPLVQHHVATQQDRDVFRTQAGAVWVAVLGDHCVAGKMVTPATAYIEMVHAARVRIQQTSPQPTLLNSVIFISPLAISLEENVYVECIMWHSTFEVHSVSNTSTVHCAGSHGGERLEQAAVNSELVRSVCDRTFHQQDAYEASTCSSTVQLHSGFQVVAQMWHSRAGATGNLHQRRDMQGTLVHPADLDSLPSTCIFAQGLTGSGALPFNINSVSLLQHRARASRVVAKPGSSGLHAGSTTTCVGDSALIEVRGKRPFTVLHGLHVRLMRSIVDRDTEYVVTWRSQPEVVQRAHEQASAAIVLLPPCVGKPKHVLQQRQQATRSLIVLVCSDMPGVAIAAAEAVLCTAIVQAHGHLLTPTLVLCTHGAQMPWLCARARSTPELASVWGLGRSFRVETRMPVASIDATNQGCLQALQVSADLYEEPDSVMRSVRLLPRLARRGPPLSNLKRSAYGQSHVITGGTSGLGLLTGRWLAQRGAQSLILCARSGALARGDSMEWHPLLQARVRAVVERCDASAIPHIRRLFSNATMLTSVWHAAGVLCDALLPQQDARALAVVFAPKSEGARWLHSAASSVALNVFVAFSSVVGILGGAGQSNYAAANTMIDGVMSTSRERGRSSVSLQWGAWAETGMASRGAASSRMAGIEVASGFRRLRLAEGLQALEISVRYAGPSEVSVVSIDWNKLVGSTQSSALVSQLLPNRAAPHATTKPVASVISLDGVVEIIAAVAGVALEPDVPLMEGGVDSLSVVEIRNCLQEALGQSTLLPNTIVFQHPTARQLALALQSQAQGVEHDPTSMRPSSKIIDVDAVLAIVERTAGILVDLDMPVMEAGIDSLSIVELRNELQEAAGTDGRLPVTLVFDHPSVRQLAAVFNTCRNSDQHVAGSSSHTVGVESFLTMRGLGGHLAHFKSEG